VVTEQKKTEKSSGFQHSNISSKLSTKSGPNSKLVRREKLKSDVIKRNFRRWKKIVK